MSRYYLCSNRFGGGCDIKDIVHIYTNETDAINWAFSETESKVVETLDIMKDRLERWKTEGKSKYYIRKLKKEIEYLDSISKIKIGNYGDELLVTYIDVEKGRSKFESYIRILDLDD